jgi:predicted dehydrogenase
MIEGSAAPKKTKKLTYGMVGGGEGAFIGEVHRKSIAMDGKAELVAGCFSRDHQNTLHTGKILGLDEDRLYASFEEMMPAEGQRKDKIDFVVIVTPNSSHFTIAKSAMENGIHVVCDKPLTCNSGDAEELARLSAEKDLLFCVTYTYTGYPMVKHLREMVANGELGDIRFVNAEYPQEWLSTFLEESGNKQAAWRTDPALTGASNRVGDIGSHIANMVSYLTGLKIRSLCARLDTFVEGRTLDDNASIMVEYDGGAKGLYWSSQIAVGNDNGLRVRIYGSDGSVQWCQENPNYAEVCYLNKPKVILSRGRDDMYPHAQGYSRIPAGHPEGYFEAFANIYATFCDALAKKQAGEALKAGEMDYPGADEGVRGVKFIEKCVESSKNGAIWINF